MNVNGVGSYAATAAQTSTPANVDASVSSNDAPPPSSTAPESTTVTLSPEALSRAAMSVGDPGNWPKPPQ